MLWEAALKINHLLEPLICLHAEWGKDGVGRNQSVWDCYDLRKPQRDSGSLGEGDKHLFGRLVRLSSR